MNDGFKTQFARDIFQAKYAHEGAETWDRLAHTVANDVCGGLLRQPDIDYIEKIIREKKFIPAGRYLNYAGRPKKFFNNCVSLSVEDTRESWADLMQRAGTSLMCGAGIGVNYSKIRPKGAPISKTGGTASGPLSLVMILNEIGRHVMQGGSRRSAMWAGLDWNHPDIGDYVQAKLWSEELKRLKMKDFNSPAPLDMTNISVLFNDEFWHQVEVHKDIPLIFNQIIRQACEFGEPGMCFNYGTAAKETQRNACGEFISDQDDDVCNLGSVNLARCSWAELSDVCRAGSMFLTCGSVKADLPYERLSETREKYRKIGLGLMGVSEWFLQRNLPYGHNDIRPLLITWRDSSEWGGRLAAHHIGISEPIRFRSVAPAGTISIIGETTSGIEPLFAVALKRRYLTNGKEWKSQYVIDQTAKMLIDKYELEPDDIETAMNLAEDPERRIKFQAMVQDYTDMGISSTINLPRWGTQYNNEETARKLTALVLKYHERLRGITFYPEGAIPGQVLTAVPYAEAESKKGKVFDEFSEQQCRGGTCGI